MAPKDEKQVDRIFSGWLDDLPSLSSKVRERERERMSYLENNFSTAVSRLENTKVSVYVCTVEFLC